MKQCIHCHETKSIDEFNRDRYRPDGHKDFCRNCDREKQRSRYSTPEGRARKNSWEREYRSRPDVRKRTRKNYQKWASSDKGKEARRINASKHRKKYPNRAVAHTALYYAVKCGLIFPSKLCEFCGEPPDTENPLEAHHWRGYENPKDWVDVKWVHRAICHSKSEKTLPENWPNMLAGGS